MIKYSETLLTGFVNTVSNKSICISSQTIDNKSLSLGSPFFRSLYHLGINKLSDIIRDISLTIGSADVGPIGDYYF